MCRCRCVLRHLRQMQAICTGVGTVQVHAVNKARLGTACGWAAVSTGGIDKGRESCSGTGLPQVQARCSNTVHVP